MELERRTLEALDWAYLLEALAARTATAQGRRAALALEPLGSLDEISELLDAVDDAARLEADEALLSPLAGVDDIAGEVREAARGEVLDLERLAAVAVTVSALVGLAEYLGARAEAAPTLARWAAAIAIDEHLQRSLAAALDAEGQLSAKTYPVLGELRRRIAALERRARETLERLLATGELSDVLQDDYITRRGDRLVVPIKAQAKNLGLGIVHDSSRSGRTVYVEPHQVVPLSNEQRMAEAEFVGEQLRILRDLSAEIGRSADSLAMALERATAVDLTVARLKLARSLDATRPQVSAEGVVRLIAARHPLLVLDGTEVVANDLSVDGQCPVLVLTGPNAGGKTVALKTVGLCVLLVRIGCFIPAAQGSRIDLLGEVLADIGDQQSVHGGLSSFSGHLLALRAMLERAGPSSLLLLDELAAGTDPAQGGALGRALLERFAHCGARVVATTHYAQVKGMAAADARVAVAAMEYRDEQPTYRVVPGVAGDSHGLAAALRAGLDAALVERARELMDRGERALHEALAALEDERARSSELAARAKEALAEAAARESSLARREARIKGRAEQLEREAAAQFVERLREAEGEIGRIVAELQRGPTAQAAAAARAAVRSAGELPRRTSSAAASSQTSGPPVVGERVRIGRLGLSGEVVAVRSHEIEVAAGRATVRVDTHEIERLGQPGRRPAAATTGEPRSSAGKRRARRGEVVRSSANTLDLRGQRVAAGLEMLERYLDDAVLRGDDGVFVLHGHGTGAMKAAVREALAVSEYVCESGPAPSEQGGDGVTVVILRG